MRKGGKRNTTANFGDNPGKHKSSPNFVVFIMLDLPDFLTSEDPNNTFAKTSLTALLAQLGERQTEDLKVLCSIHRQSIFFCLFSLLPISFTLVCTMHDSGVIGCWVYYDLVVLQWQCPRTRSLPIFLYLPAYLNLWRTEVGYIMSHKTNATYAMLSAKHLNTKFALSMATRE